MSAIYFQLQFAISLLQLLPVVAQVLIYISSRFAWRNYHILSSFSFSVSLHTFLLTVWIIQWLYMLTEINKSVEDNEYGNDLLLTIDLLPYYIYTYLTWLSFLMRSNWKCSISLFSMFHIYLCVAIWQQR